MGIVGIEWEKLFKALSMDWHTKKYSIDANYHHLLFLLCSGCFTRKYQALPRTRALALFTEACFANKVAVPCFGECDLATMWRTVVSKGGTFMGELLNTVVQKALEEILPHGVGGRLQRSAGHLFVFQGLNSRERWDGRSLKRFPQKICILS